MSDTSLTDAPNDLAPVASTERIQALDVIRGFALMGIFLMNIEFFNRPTGEIGSGLPTTLQGIDWLAGYLIYILVQGKFWTMFSLLFGMGFAVMLTRAERAGRGFLAPYLRRIAALAIFGAFHHIFLWSGDILFSYAVGAVCLLLLLWMRWWALLLIVVSMAMLASVQGDFGQVSAGLMLIWLGGLYFATNARIGDGNLRRGLARIVKFLSFGTLKPGWGAESVAAEPAADRLGRMPWHSLLFLTLATIGLAAAAMAGVVPDFPADARWPILIGTLFMLLLGYLSWRFKNPVEARPRRLGGTMYLVPFCVMLSFGLLQVFGPERPKPTEAQVAAAMVELKAKEAEEKAAKANPALANAGDAKGPAAKGVAGKAKEPQKTPQERAAMGEAQNRKWRAEHDVEIANELRISTSGTYGEFVRLRAKELWEKVPGEFNFATLIVGMFLLGYWFVRSGIMEHPDRHLPLFRKMAMIGIPLGVGLGVLATFIATHNSPGVERDPYQIAMALMMIGNLPACLGYVALVVLMLHSRSPLSRIDVLAPLGRMALTNYLTHSLVCSFIFYGYGLGQFGMGRAMQVGFVFAVLALQIVFCHWWLSKFRYGPMEWLWRVITYWKFTPLRREPGVLLDSRQVSA